MDEMKYVCASRNKMTEEDHCNLDTVTVKLLLNINEAFSLL